MDKLGTTDCIYQTTAQPSYNGITVASEFTNDANNPVVSPWYRSSLQERQVKGLAPYLIIVRFSFPRAASGLPVLPE